MLNGYQTGYNELKSIYTIFNAFLFETTAPIFRRLLIGLAVCFAVPYVAQESAPLLTVHCALLSP